MGNLSQRKSSQAVPTLVRTVLLIRSLPRSRITLLKLSLQDPSGDNDDHRVSQLLARFLNFRASQDYGLTVVDYERGRKRRHFFPLGLLTHEPLGFDFEGLFKRSTGLKKRNGPR